MRKRGCCCCCDGRHGGGIIAQSSGRRRTTTTRRTMAKKRTTRTASEMMWMMSMMMSMMMMTMIGVDVMAVVVNQRDCRGRVRHVHLSVGPDPSTSVVVSFSSTTPHKDDDDDDDGPLLGGVIVGEHRHRLERVVRESEPAIFYEAMQPHRVGGGNYTSPRQHHVLVENLKPDTVYWYQCVTKHHRGGFDALQSMLDDQFGIAKDRDSSNAKKENKDNQREDEEEEEEAAEEKEAAELIADEINQEFEEEIAVHNKNYAADDDDKGGRDLMDADSLRQGTGRHGRDELPQQQQVLHTRSLSHRKQALHQQQQPLSKQHRQQQLPRDDERNDPGLLRHARIVDLSEDQGRYRRRLSPPPYDSTQRHCPDPKRIRSFRTAPRPGHYPGGKNLKIGVIGDIGQFAHSEETLQHMMHHHGPELLDFLLLAGDLAYPDYDHRQWDTFFDFLDDYPLVDQVPLQVALGNHDIDKAEKDVQICQAYEARFRMPRIRPPQKGVLDGTGVLQGQYTRDGTPINFADGLLNMDNPPYPIPYEYGNAYYSFVYGLVHVIVLSSYSSVEPGSIQYEWFVEELSVRVDRTVTPWLFLMFHCPVYNTFHIHQKDYQVIAAREHIEPLLVQYKVNVVFTGHVHAYLRTHPVANGEVQHPSSSDGGPVHITMGAGGRAANAPFYNLEPEEWVAVRDGSLYGYGLVEIFNATHMRWDWVHTGREAKHNYLWNSDPHKEKELPPGGTDGVILQNHYYCANER